MDGPKYKTISFHFQENNYKTNCTLENFLRGKFCLVKHGKKPHEYPDNTSKIPVKQCSNNGDNSELAQGRTINPDSETTNPDFFFHKFCW